MAVVGFVSGRRNAGAIRTLESRLAALERRLAETGSVDTTTAAAATADRPLPAAATTATETTDAEAKADSGPEPAEEGWAAAQPGLHAESAATEQAEPADAIEMPESVEESAAPRESFEKQLASRWLVWLGAVALALAGTFLVKYAMDEGLLGPAVRVSLGLLLGLSLAGAGEWLRRRPLSRAIAAVRPDYVPQALAAGGIFTGFASIYAAYALYGLLSPLAAFIGLAIVALGAVGLSLLQGWFVALLGLVGAYLTPALVATTEPSAWALFVYLLFVQAACLTVFRYMKWRWLARSTLAGGALWPLFWFIGPFTPPDVWPAGIYLLLIAGLYVWHPARQPVTAGNWLQTMRELDPSARLGWSAACVIALLAVPMLIVAEAAPPAAFMAGLLAVFYLVVARRDPAFDGLAVVAALMTVALIAVWTLPDVDYYVRSLAASGEFGRYTRLDDLLAEAGLRAYTLGGLLFAVLFAGVGFAALWGAARPPVWAGVAAFTPVAILIVCYWRIAGFAVDYGWATVAVILAGLNLFAATRIARYRAADALAVSLGFHAAGVVAALSLAMAMSLEQAWLTVALSLQLPALAWIAGRVPARPFRVIAAIVAAIVLVRLVFNVEVLDYETVEGAWITWITYGYGIPAAMFFIAARGFRKTGEGPVVTLLEAGALTFLVLFVSMQLRHFAGGSLTAYYDDLTEFGLQAICWLTIAATLAELERRHGNPVARYGARILTGLAIGQIVLLHLVLFNPMFTGDPVGEYPVLNTLTLGYGLPAALLLLIAARNRATMANLSRAAAVLGFVLVFADLTFEVRRAFHGSDLNIASGQTVAESYCYSLAWLVYALALLGLGIRLRLQPLRFASLAVLLVAVAKVFLFDMAGLDGLYRVASFLGLGLALVGIGYLYQRFVFARPPVPPAA
ncbi:DUF2339 domain-containing protein [Oceanibacterium hippocampi]|uniref:DUF2339 domain-containing protein n=1 Tax=Oceanibacterium hippocampi TaxID=745714 RepID=A0A1Y5SBI3_9PROT|nr:DUF2339 domain-containing protein [Oceanibacterium hippocampi]SLN33911.1 hypothetical protein OCH7691_01308 [Oceanibacterium hippocampi]